MARDKITLRVLDAAEADFHEALRYYAQRDRAVARRFDRLIKRITAIIVDEPGPLADP
ncbi:MAG TPA: hypothetical protein VH853_25935 [Polyangia bacterium]|nr:hypothetical protein [Polyangia bacterium]